MFGPVIIQESIALYVFQIDLHKATSTIKLSISFFSIESEKISCWGYIKIVYVDLL